MLLFMTMSLYFLIMLTSKKNSIVQTKKLKMFVSVKPQYEMKVGYILAATEECFGYTTLIRIKEREKRKKTKQSAQQMEKHIT